MRWIQLWNTSLQSRLFIFLNMWLYLCMVKYATTKPICCEIFSVHIQLEMFLQYKYGKYKTSNFKHNFLHKCPHSQSIIHIMYKYSNRSYDIWSISYALTKMDSVSFSLCTPKRQMAHFFYFQRFLTSKTYF